MITQYYNYDLKIHIVPETYSQSDSILSFHVLVLWCSLMGIWAL